MALFLHQCCTQMLQSSSSTEQAFGSEPEHSSAAQQEQHGKKSFEKKAKRSPYLAQQPGVVLGEPCPVSVRGDSRILEAVLDGGGRADVFIQEFLPRLLGDGFG